MPLSPDPDGDGVCEGNYVVSPYPYNLSSNYDDYDGPGSHSWLSVYPRGKAADYDRILPFRPPPAS